jgi:predicted neutral ceramidase superfamily lipid hydrolase
MNSDRALDDLKAIRQIMERTRRGGGKTGGWYMILWGAIWFVGFLGNQFLPDETAGLLWFGLNIPGAAISVWLGVRSGRQGGVRSTAWRPILLWWLALFIFDGLMIWLFQLHTGRDLTLLITLTVALGFVLFGLFVYWVISAVGVLVAVLVVGTAVLLPDYLYLVMAFLGGGLLMGSGIWFVRSGE